MRDNINSRQNFSRISNDFRERKNKLYYNDTISEKKEKTPEKRERILWNNSPNKTKMNFFKKLRINDVNSTVRSSVYGSLSKSNNGDLLENQNDISSILKRNTLLHPNLNDKHRIKYFMVKII
jgi:hypothetical protein